MTTATPESRPGLSRDAGVGVASGNGAIPPARLACTGVTVRFGGLTAVQSVDLAVPPGAITGLVGPNGAGKSTLFGVVSGLLRPSAGKVFIDGEDVTGARPQVRAEKGLARTFQHPELFTGLVVRDHLVLAYRAKHAKARVWADLFTMGSLRRASMAEKETVDHLVELIGIKSIANTPALGLPLGLSRLVELGRALAASPTILLLDEPSSGLDSSETEQLEATLRRVAQESGVSVLLVEHDVELVMRLCATIYVLDFGELIAHGTPPEIRASDVVRSAYLGEEIEGEEALEEAADVEDAAEISDFLSKDTAATPTPAVPVQPGDQSRNDVAARLIVENLSVRYGEAIAVSGVSFSVGAGKALAILGANGAGKTSIARAISGLVPPCGGTVMFEGDETTSASPDRIRRAGLVHLPEGRGIFRSLTVSENLRMATATLKSRPERQQAVERAFEIFPVLGRRQRQRAGSLSGGEQQMLSLARALITSPKLLIADELSLGLAPILVDLLFEGLTRALNEGITVVIIEQYVHRALGFADDCLVLQRGEVTWHGPAKAARGEVLQRYLGEATAS